MYIQYRKTLTDGIVQMPNFIPELQTFILLVQNASSLLIHNSSFVDLIQPIHHFYSPQRPPFPGPEPAAAAAVHLDPSDNPTELLMFNYKIPRFQYKTPRFQYKTPHFYSPHSNRQSQTPPVAAGAACADGPSSEALRSDGFVLEMMDFALKMMAFALKMSNFTLLSELLPYDAHDILASPRNSAFEILRLCFFIIKSTHFSIGNQDS